MQPNHAITSDHQGKLWEVDLTCLEDFERGGFKTILETALPFKDPLDLITLDGWVYIYFNGNELIEDHCLPYNEPINQCYVLETDKGTGEMFPS